MSPELTAFLRSWSFGPTIVAGLALAAGLYVAGWRRLTRRDRGRVVLPAWRAWCYAGGLAAIALALLSPIAAFSGLFFFMHMTQHLLLALLAPPLLWLGKPVLVGLWALPGGLRLGLGRLLTLGHPVRGLLDTLTHPPTATLLFLVTVGLWHVPAFYDAAQGRTLAHDLQHILFLGTGLLYWWPVVPPIGTRRLGYGLTLLYFLPPMLEGKLIGPLLTFASTPLYATYRAAPRLWGLSALDDQKLGGTLMWVGGAFFWLAAMTVVFFVWASQEEDEARGGPLRPGLEVGQPADVDRPPPAGAVGGPRPRLLAPGAPGRRSASRSRAG